jgi:hypothetical protein
LIQQTKLCKPNKLAPETVCCLTLCHRLGLCKVS